MDIKKWMIFGLAIGLVTSVIHPVHAAPNGISEWAIVLEAFSWLGVPYELGGESKNGVDCSGLVHQVYNRAGAPFVYYKDRSAEDIRYSPNSYSVYPPRTGDVVLFQEKYGPNKGKWTHIGIYLWENKFIHSSYYARKVVYDDLYYSPYYGRGWWYKNYNVAFVRYNPDYP